MMRAYTSTKPKQPKTNINTNEKHRENHHNANPETNNDINGYTNTSVEKIYMDTMDKKTKLAMNIAMEHLGSSFHLLKSNGYIQYTQTTPK